MDFKNMIIEGRKKQNMTQREMAEKLNVSDKTISKWETGVNFPDLKMLNQISKLIGISVAELLMADDLKQPKIDMSRDNIVIGQYKTKQIIALILFGLSTVCIGLSPAGLLMFMLGIIVFGASVILFISSVISFKIYYELRSDTVKFDRLNNFYSLLYFDSILLILFLSFIFLSGYFAFQQIILVLFQVGPFLIRNRILKLTNYESKQDTVNSVLTKTYWIIVIGGNLMYLVFSLGWIKLSLNLFESTMLMGFTSFLFFSPVVISYIISLRRTPNSI
jgi:transcriptional regulator with XRE-family HTH domain